MSGAINSKYVSFSSGKLIHNQRTLFKQFAYHSKTLWLVCFYGLVFHSQFYFMKLPFPQQPVYVNPNISSQGFPF